MRLKKWKSFLSIFMASALMMSTAAYGNPVVITPLEESQVASFQSGSPAQGQGPDGSYGSSGTGSVGGGADSAGVVSSTIQTIQITQAAPQGHPRQRMGRLPDQRGQEAVPV